MKSPIGHLFMARDGGLHSALDLEAADYIRAQAAKEGGQMEVKGTAVQYGVVGHFPFWGAMRLEAGAIMEAPGKHTKYRDVLALYSHNADQVLGRVGANTLSLSYNKKDIGYSMRLNPQDSLAQDVWARLQRGDLNSASIGFVPVEGEWVEEQPDNSLDAEADRETIDVFSVSKAELIEVSIVAQGAFYGATSEPASADASEAVEAVSALSEAVEEAHQVLEFAVTASSEGDKVDADGTATITTDAEPGTSPDLAEGGEGDDGGGGSKVVGGPTEPDDGDGGNAEEGAQQEAEAQGLMLKDVISTMSYDLRKEIV